MAFGGRLQWLPDSGGFHPPSGPLTSWGQVFFRARRSWQGQELSWFNWSPERSPGCPCACSMLSCPEPSLSEKARGPGTQGPGGWAPSLPRLGLGPLCPSTRHCAKGGLHQSLSMESGAMAVPRPGSDSAPRPPPPVGLFPELGACVKRVPLDNTCQHQGGGSARSHCHRDPPHC